MLASSLLDRRHTPDNHRPPTTHRHHIMTAESFKEKGNEFFKKGDYERVRRRRRADDSDMRRPMAERQGEDITTDGHRRGKHSGTDMRTWVA